MSDFTYYVEEAIRDWMSQGSSMPSAPSDLYVALHTDDPTDDPDGSTEVDASDYDRASTSTGSDWDETGSGSPYGFENASEISFGEATSDWGEVSHVSIWDASDTDGDAYASFSLSSSKEITDGDEARFSAGDLSFDID